MPLLKIQTNQTVDDARRQQLIEKASRAVAEMLGKSERYVMVSFEHNPNMLFGGSSDALAYVEMKSIGLPETETGEFSARLTDLLCTALDLAAERIYIEFANAPRSMWGWNGGTF